MTTTHNQVIIGAEEQLRILEYSVKNNMPVLMIGETGVGKTALIRHLAQKNKVNLRRVNLNGQTTVDEFVGKTLLNKSGTFWQDGVLIKAMKEGSWLVLDELNAALPEILFVLHSLMDDDKYVMLSENEGEIITPHKDFRLFATMNPSGKYAGTKELNKALLSRFPMIVQVEYPNVDMETNILKHYAPELETSVISTMVKMANELRTAYKKEDIEYVCSTRDLINLAIVSQTLGMKDAIQLSLLNRVNEEDRAAVITITKLFFDIKGATVWVDPVPKLNKIIEGLETEVEELRRDYRVLAQDSQDRLKTMLEGMKLFEAQIGIRKDKEMVQDFKLGFIPTTRRVWFASEINKSIKIRGLDSARARAIDNLLEGR